MTYVYRVVAVDLRGYNESDKPSGFKNYFIQHIIQDIKELIPALGKIIKRVYLVAAVMHHVMVVMTKIDWIELHQTL